MNSRKLLAELVKNWPAKVLSVALALLLVVFHRMSTLELRFFSVPLQVEGEGSLVSLSPPVRTVRVSLRGDHDSIYLILEDDIEAFIDLSAYTEPGAYRLPVQIRKKGSALGLEALEVGVEPQEIFLELDRRLSRSPAPPMVPDPALRGQRVLGAFDTPVREDA